MQTVEGPGIQLTTNNTDGREGKESAASSAGGEIYFTSMAKHSTPDPSN